MDDDYAGGFPYDIDDYVDWNEDVCTDDCADGYAASADDCVDVGAGAGAWEDYDGSDVCDGECADAFADGNDEDCVEEAWGDDAAETSDAAVMEPWTVGIEESFDDERVDPWIDGCEEAEASDNNRADPLIDDCEEAEASDDAYSDEGSAWFSDHFPPDSPGALPTAEDEETAWNHLDLSIASSDSETDAVGSGAPPFFQDVDRHLFQGGHFRMAILQESETDSVGSEFESDEHIEPEPASRPAVRSVVEHLPTVMVALADQMDSCAVCTDEFIVGATAKLLPCTHRYHEDCILPWLRVRNTCPICRIELPAEVPAQTHLGGGVYLLS